MDVKKVLIFSLAYYPRHVGGAEVAIKEITDRLPDFEFHLVCLRFDSLLPRTEKIGNVVVHRIGWGVSNPTARMLQSFRYRLLKLWFQFAAAYVGLRLNREYHFDIVWAMMAHSCGVPAGLYKFFKPKVRYVLTLQEGDPIKHIERTMLPLWPLFTRAFTSADIVQTISTFLSKWARSRNFKGPLEVIPNGVDAKKFLGEKVPHEGVVLITSSRLVHKNAVDDVIRALSLLPAEVTFVAVGTGSDEMPLKALAARLGVSDRVTFKGFVPYQELPALLHASDIFIRPSRSEGMGNAFIEAMAAGLPVIATQEGGIADFLFDAKRNPDKPTTGWAVDVDSPEQIAKAVKDILANPDAAKRVIETTRTMTLEKYDWDLIAKHMQERVFSRVS